MRTLHLLSEDKALASARLSALAFEHQLHATPLPGVISFRSQDPHSAHMPPGGWACLPKDEPWAQRGGARGLSLRVRGGKWQAGRPPSALSALHLELWKKAVPLEGEGEEEPAPRGRGKQGSAGQRFPNQADH